MSLIKKYNLYKKTIVQIDIDKSDLYHDNQFTTFELEKISRFVFLKARCTNSLGFMRKLKIRISGNTRKPGLCIIMTNRAARILRAKKRLWVDVATKANHGFRTYTDNKSWAVFRSTYVLDKSITIFPFLVHSNTKIIKK